MMALVSELHQILEAHQGYRSVSAMSILIGVHLRARDLGLYRDYSNVYDVVLHRTMHVGNQSLDR